MDDSTGVPAKRQKIEENCEHNGDPVAVKESGSQITKPKSTLNLNIKPQALARLRQIAKNSNIGGVSPQKQTEQQKDEMKETNSHNTEQFKETRERTDLNDAKNSNDVIISSAGSSPAHSPKPQDLVVLSTPPKKPSLTENHYGTTAVLKNLFSLPDQSQGHRDPKEKNYKSTKDTSSLINGDKAVTTNGVDKPKLSSTQIPSLNFGTAELKKLLKAMIDEKFKEVEDMYMSQGTESELKERIARLEDENRSLQEYASKLEKAVKLLLDNQKNKKNRCTKGAQTDDVGLARLRTLISTKPSTPVQQVSTQPKQIQQAPPLTTTGPLSQLQQQQQQINQANQQGTLVTSRLTPTQAAIPGHSVTPASLPQRVSYTQQLLITNSQGQRPAQYQTAPQTRPAPVTVTVHPQTTTTSMISSPPYSTQVQKATFLTNSAARQQVPLQQPKVQQRMPNSQPMVVYQRLPAPQQGSIQPVQQFTNTTTSQRPATQAPQPVGVNNQQRTLQTPVRPQLPPNLAVSPREQTNNVPPKDLPARPVVSIAVVSNGIVLSWNMINQPQTAARIARYQLFALQDVGSNTAQWKKIGVVNALPLPMACTLTQFLPGNKYHFTVRAQDEHGRCGPLSEPCTVTLT